jgi:hypothetical protein
MSYLVLGKRLDALLIAKGLLEGGWQVHLATKDTFEYEFNPVLMERKVIEKAGFDFLDGLLNYVNKIEITDLDGKINKQNSEYLVVDLSVFERKLFNEIKDKVKIYENTCIMDKSTDSKGVFIKTDNKGAFIKADYIIDAEDLDLAEKINKKLTFKKYISAVVKRRAPIGILDLYFTRKGYYYIINYNETEALLYFVGTNIRDYNSFVQKNKLNVLNEIRDVLVDFDPTYKYNFENTYLIGNAAGLTNNLNFNNLIPSLCFAMDKNTFPNLILKRKVELIKKYNQFYDLLKESNKKAKFFWNLSHDSKNKILSKIDLTRGVLDFKSMFKKMPIMLKLKYAFK